MRLFLGIHLAEKVIGELSAVTMRLGADGDGLRWSAPESWHVTLQFLGKIDPEQLLCIVSQLGALRLPPVPIVLEQMDCFDRAGIFFVGVRLSPQLLLLQRGVTAATGRCGFVPESRPYRPHITLARSKGKRARQDLRQLKSKIGRQPNFTSFIAEDFLLYESFPAAGGSRYEIRERFSLSGR